MESSPKTEEQAKAEQLLRDAHIQRMRKQWATAETLCREALKLDPDDGMAREMLGDLLMEKGSVDEALETYRAALERQPGKAVLEEKVARAVLQQDAERRSRAEAELMLASPKLKGEKKRGVAVAVMLSVLCPGVGQMVLGDYVKGTAMLVVGLGGLFLGGLDLLKFLTGTMDRNGGSPMLALIGGVGLLTWLYSLIDAASQANQSKVRGGDV